MSLPVQERAGTCWSSLQRAIVFLAGLWVVASGLPPLHAQIAVIGNGGPGPVKAQHLTAELVSLGPSIAPGGSQVVGLAMTLEQGWHVYWVNAGDSGEPPHIDWSLPQGFTAGPMQFPVPSRLPLGPLMDFGYRITLHFRSPLQRTAPPQQAPRTWMRRYRGWSVRTSVSRAKLTLGWT